MTGVQIDRIPLWFTWTWTLAAIAAGRWRGGFAGRVVAAILAIQLARGTFWDIPFAQTVAADLLTLAVCLALVLRGCRWWTVWAAASALLSVCTDVLRIAIPGLTPWAFYSAQVAWFHVLGAALLGGALTQPPRHAPPSAAD